MGTRELRKDQWVDYFDSFSRTHRGTRASVETIGKELGVLSNAMALPFMGITFEPATEPPAIEVLVGGPNAPHVSHTIAAPTRVHVREGNDRRTAVIQIESAGCTTLIYVGRGAQALAPGFISDELIRASRVVSPAAAMINQ